MYHCKKLTLLKGAVCKCMEFVEIILQSNLSKMRLGDIQVLRNAVEVGCVRFPGEKRYEGVRFNIYQEFKVIGVTRGWVGVHFP